MLDGINRAFTDCGLTNKLMELVAKYRAVCDQEASALHELQAAEDKCQALQEAIQAERIAKQEYLDAQQEHNKQQDKFNENNAELISAFCKAAAARRDAEWQLLKEIRR